MTGNTETGKIGWVDITVDDAKGLRDFYANVVGWKPEDVSMGEYCDFSMAMPGSGSFCVIRDPSGAVAALYQAASE